MPRLPPIVADQLSPSQRAVYDAICAGPRGAVGGPFTVLLHNPELASRIESLGKQLRFDSSIQPRLRELATCIVGAHWRADYEWHAHAPLARAQGIPEATLDAIACHQQPRFEVAAEAAIHDFVKQLLTRGRVDDAVYQATIEALGQDAVLELTALVGYYSLLALLLNAFCVEAPASSRIPWRNP